MPKKDARIHVVYLRLTAKEKRRLDEAADLDEMPAALWIRTLANRAAARKLAQAT